MLADAAVVAAPILKEWLDIGVLILDGRADFSIVFSLRCVRYDPSSYVNSGPSLVGCKIKYSDNAFTGHRLLYVGVKQMEQPYLKGSVFELFISNVHFWILLTWASVNKRVDNGSKFLVVGDTNSEDRRKPKKADVPAAHSIQRFVVDKLDEDKNW